MAKKPENHRERWSRQEENRLRELARQNTPTRVISIKLERTPLEYAKMYENLLTKNQETVRL